MRLFILKQPMPMPSRKLKMSCSAVYGYFDTL